jgi:DNA polymerase-3 subunit beta
VKFRCEREVLLDALSTAGRAISSRSGQHPALSGLRLSVTGDLLRVTGSDLDTTITSEVQVNGLGDGVAVLPKLVSDIVRSLAEGAVDVDTTGDQPRVACGRSEFFLNALPEDEYPLGKDPVGESVTLRAGALTEGLRQVVKAASTDENRATLNGVLVESEESGLRLVATDSYRLAVRDLPGTTALEAGRSVLIPSRAVAELARILEEDSDVTIVLSDLDVIFEVDAQHLRTRLIQAEFPDYRRLIPSDDSQPTVRVLRQPLIEALKRVKLMTNEKSPVKLRVDGDELVLEATNSELGRAEEAVDVKYDGDAVTVAFNPEFLLQGLEVTAGDEVTIGITDPTKPAVIRPFDSGDFLYLLMPVRVS